MNASTRNDTRRIKARARILSYRIVSSGMMVPRRLTASMRPLPDFLIIGAQKCGTASMFAYLTAHPSIARSFKKEVHFFDNNFHRGESWYRAFFPLTADRRRSSRDVAICGDASPYYLFHPHAPRRAAQTVPGAKLIVLLRDPVRRAFSQYRHRVRSGQERRAFEEVLNEEKAQFPTEYARLCEDESYRSHYHQHSCYLARGRYLEQLERWARWFPREAMLIIRSESLFHDPAGVYTRVLGFLGVPNNFLPRFEVHNKGGGESSPKQDTADWLRAYYQPYNSALYQWLGEDFDW